LKHKDLRVAILHYWFVTWRGGEKVVESILKLFPHADIYTLFYDENVCGPYLQGRKIYTSVLNSPFLRKRHQKVFPLYPLGIHSLQLQGTYDLIISSESGPIKGLKVDRSIPHLCYVHTPMRYCWGFTADYIKVVPPVLRKATEWGFEYLRKYDETTIDNVDHYVANSQNVRKRIQSYYQRDAAVVYPPIANELFCKENLVQKKAAERTHYLSFGALTPYKNIDLLVNTFNQTGEPLVVIGSGSERTALEAKAKSNIRFLGQQDWPTIKAAILNAKALLFPGEEDFGMIPLEVMAHGIPVIALSKGGALETVIDCMDSPEQSSGCFFKEPTVESLLEALKRFEQRMDQFDPEWIQNHARQFAEVHFQNNFLKEVEYVLTHKNQQN
jgi:glycosyltransferase involved in cell wall biosynthesis